MQSWGTRGNILHANFYYAVNFWFQRGKEERLLIKNVQFTSRFSLISRVVEPLLCCIIQMCGLSSRLGSQRWRVRIPLSTKYSKSFRLVKTLNFYYIFYIGNGILIGLRWQKCYWYRHISIFQLILLENYSFEFCQGLKWRIFSFRFLSTTSPSRLLIIFSKSGPLDLLYFSPTVMFEGEEKLQQSF